MVSQGYWFKGDGEKKKIQERDSKKDKWEMYSKEGLKQRMDNIAYKNLPNVWLQQRIFYKE